MCSHTARQPHKSTLVLLRCFKRKSLRQPLPSSALVGKTSLTLSGIVVCAVPVAVLSSVAVFFIRIPVDAAISAIMSAELAFGELTNLDLFLLHLHSLLSIVYKVKKTLTGLSSCLFLPYHGCVPQPREIILSKNNNVL